MAGFETPEVRFCNLVKELAQPGASDKLPFMTAEYELNDKESFFGQWVDSIRVNCDIDPENMKAKAQDSVISFYSLQFIQRNTSRSGLAYDEHPFYWEVEPHDNYWPIRNVEEWRAKADRLVEYVRDARHAGRLTLKATANLSSC